MTSTRPLSYFAWFSARWPSSSPETRAKEMEAEMLQEGETLQATDPKGRPPRQQLGLVA